MSERSDLRDGIIGFIIYTLLLLTSVWGSPLSIISLCFLPLPVLVYTAKHSRKAGFILALALIVSSLIFDFFLAVMTLVFVGAGWGMGQFHHSQRRSIQGLLLTGTITLVAGIYVMLALSSTVLEFHVLQELEQQWTRTSAMYQSFWEQAGLEINENELQNVRDVMGSLLPFAFTVMAGSMTLINHGAGRFILRRLNIPTVALPPFRERYFPRSLLAWYIISIILSYASQPGTYWYMVGMTASWLIQLLFVVQALALLTALLFRFVRIKGMWLILLAVLFSPIIAVAFLFLYLPLSFLGMLDIGFRFRDKLNHP